MKKKLKYFYDLFKKFDFILILVTVFLSVYALSLSNYLDNQTLTSIKYILYLLPSILILANLGNIKAEANVLDLLSVDMIFVFLYIAIAEQTIFSYVVLGLLFLQVIIRACTYKCENEITSSNSKQYMARLNYHFPLLVVTIVAASLAFVLHYIENLLDVDAILVTRVINNTIVTIFPAVFLIIIGLLGKKKIYILDYATYIILIFSIMTCITKHNIIPFTTLIIPFISFALRAYTYNGDFLGKKRKYFSSLANKYHLILPGILALLSGCFLIYSYTNAVIFPQYPEVTLDLAIVFPILIGVCILLIIGIFSFNKFKASQITITDYLLVTLNGINFFIFVALLTIFLRFPESIKEFSFIIPDVFKETLNICYLSVFAVCLILGLGLLVYRYKKYINCDVTEQVEEPLIENNEVEEKPDIVDSKQENNIEQIEEEDTIIEPDQIFDNLEDEELEEDDLEEEASDTPLKEPVAISREENQEEVIASSDKETALAISKIKYEAKLMFADEKIKQFYSDIKNHIMSYGATSRISSSKETFRKKGVIAVIKMAGHFFNVYLAIIPDPFIEAGYKVKDASAVKQYEETPTMIKIKSAKSFEEFKQIFDVMMINKEIKQKARFVPTDYKNVLIPNGEAIFNGLGYSSDLIVTSINAKIIPQDLPDKLLAFVPTIIDSSIPNSPNYKVVYLDTLCNYFLDGDLVNRVTLIEKKLIDSEDMIHIKARGTLDKRLTFYAEKYDAEALKMIYLTNGAAVIVSHE